MKRKIKNIEEMEKILNSKIELISKLNFILDEFEKQQKDFVKLMKYYSSKGWLNDHSLMIDDKLPQELFCGVLTEDGVYNVIDDNLDIGHRLVKIANKIFQDNSIN